EYVNYNQLATLGGDRDKLKQGLGGSGSLKSAKFLRDFFRADVVSLVVPNNDANGALGIAYVPQRKPAPLDQWALNVWTVQGTVQHYSLAHEVGHNLGAGHSPDDGNAEEDLGAYSYSRGHRVAGGGSTVMVATPGYCGLPPNDCPLQLQYSNPGVGFLNRPWVLSGSSSANNAWTVDQLNGVSANFRRAGTYLGWWSVSDDLDSEVEFAVNWRGGSSDIGLVGDWNGDGIDTPAVFRRSTGQWFVSNSWTGLQDVPTFGWGGGPGTGSGDVPLAGDWDGDGIDTIAIFRVVDGLGQWHRNDHLDGATEAVTFFGGAGDVPFVHDYDGNGTDRPGVFRPWLTQTNWHLANTWGSSANVYCSFGGGVTDLPVVGRWPGAPADRIGIYREGTWHLRNGCNSGTVIYVSGFGTALDRNPFVGDFTTGSDDTPGRFL
ncbi:M12 family metallo-peptidase, partial [Rhabdothermincola sp.]|uniref:M12 family metallo-peptidase n=1 Tax=Rhabdothermincola sp. TaxID=2820405 RepID=UPI002FE42975